MILDQIDQLGAEDLTRGVFELLHSGTFDFATHEKLHDRRLMPALIAIIQANGRPAFAPPSLSTPHAETVLTSAISLLGDIARPDDQEAVAVLLSCFDQGNDRVSLATAVALGQIGATEASAQIVAFTEKMLAQNELGAVARLTRALTQMGDDKAQACLQQIVAQGENSDDKHVRHVVAEAEKSIQEIENRTA